MIPGTVDANLILVITIGAVLVLVLGGTFLILATCYRRIGSATAIVLRRADGSRVSFKDLVVLPIVHSAETVDLSLRTLTVDLRGRHGVVCSDCIRADMTLSFTVRVNNTAEDVLKVADTMGCARATDPAALAELFTGKFTESVKSVAKHLEFDVLVRDRDSFKDHVIAAIGRDLNGYVLDDVAVVSIEQTPLEQLDPNDMLDAAGIRKISERTAEHNIRANEARQRERLEIARQNLDADEAALRIEQQRAELAARTGQGVHAQFIR